MTVEAADELLAVAEIKNRVANLAGNGGYAIRELNLHTIYDYCLFLFRVAQTIISRIKRMRWRISEGCPSIIMSQGGNFEAFNNAHKRLMYSLM